MMASCATAAPERPVSKSAKRSKLAGAYANEGAGLFLERFARLQQDLNDRALGLEQAARIRDYWQTFHAHIKNVAPRMNNGFKLTAFPASVEPPQQGGGLDQGDADQEDADDAADGVASDETTSKLVTEAGTTPQLSCLNRSFLENLPFVEDADMESHLGYPVRCHRVLPELPEPADESCAAETPSRRASKTPARRRSSYQRPRQIRGIGQVAKQLNESTARADRINKVRSFIDRLLTGTVETQRVVDIFIPAGPGFCKQHGNGFYGPYCAQMTEVQKHWKEQGRCMLTARTPRFDGAYYPPLYWVLNSGVAGVHVLLGSNVLVDLDGNMPAATFVSVLLATENLSRFYQVRTLVAGIWPRSEWWQKKTSTPEDDRPRVNRPCVPKVSNNIYNGFFIDSTGLQRFVNP